MDKFETAVIFALRLTHASVPIDGSNFGKVIVELKLDVGANVKL
jgi:hypothetical protein